MLTLVHLISSLNVGGAQLMLSQLVSRLNHRQLKQVVVSLIEVGPVGETIRALGVPVYSLGMQRGRPSPEGFGRLVRLLRRERPAILQTWLYHADLLGLFVARWAQTPVVVWNVRASNMDMQQYRRLSGWTVKACARLSALPRAVVVNSEAGRAFHTRIGYRPRQWVVIPNGIDLQQFRPAPAARAEVRGELGLPPEAALIGLVARFDPMKDHATFLRAARELVHAGSTAHFVLVGEGATPDNAALAELVAQEGLEGRAHLLGRRTDIPRLTAAFDIASSSSYGEGFPNVIGEAMACGVPCVATDVGDTAQIVGETGVIVPPRDPAALAEGWRRTIEMGAEQRQRLGLAARARIQQHYSLESMVRHYEELYLSLVERNPCAD